MAGYWPSYFFCMFMDGDENSFIAKIYDEKFFHDQLATV